MERLTERNEYGYPYTGIETNCVNGSYDIENPEWVDVAISRLADIEDILGDDYDLDHLRELVQADRDGKCVVLPCKAGDKVYLLNCHLGKIFENEVENFLVGYKSDNRNKINTVYVGKCGSKTFRKWKFQQVDKIVFLTREAAEAALKEREKELR